MAETLNQYVTRLLTANENSPTKRTDQDLADLIQQRYPGCAIRTVNDMRGRRHWYNTGQDYWKISGMGPADGTNRPISYEYDSQGHKISSTIKRGGGGGFKSAGGLSEERIRSIVREEMGQRPNITIVLPEKPEVTLQGATLHKKFKEALLKISAGIPVMLVGPAGSGKTHLAGQVAEAMGLGFSFNSLNEGTKESDLVGRILPNDKGEWVYQPTPFVNAYRADGDGGLHLFDEMDACNPNVLVMLNAAIANGVLSIPAMAEGSGLIKRHKNNYIVAATNTFGLGADRMYVGRTQLDAATLNRFTMGTIVVDYDRDLERQLAQGICPEGSQELITWAWRVRDAIMTNRMRRIMSTRNIIDGAKLLKVGATLGDIQGTYFSGWTADERRSLGV